MVEGVYIFLSGNYRYIRVFKLLVYLGIRAYLAVLPRGLYYRNLLLLEGPSCLYATAFHKISIDVCTNLIIQLSYIPGHEIRIVLYAL